MEKQLSLEYINRINQLVYIESFKIFKKKFLDATLPKEVLDIAKNEELLETDQIDYVSREIELQINQEKINNVPSVELSNELKEAAEEYKRLLSSGQF